MTSTFFNTLIFLMQNLIVVLSGYYILRLFNLKSGIDKIITYFLIVFSQIIITETFLGLITRLYLSYVLGLNLLILLVSYFLFKDIPLKDTDNILRKNWIIVFISSFILGFALVKVCINLINPPFGWDSLNYHFTFPVEWLKHGNLGIPITINDDPSASYYPLNGSLIYFWLMLPFKNVMLADLGQIPFFILAFLATFSIAKKMNLDDEYAFFAASLMTLVPNYFKQMSIAYVDVMVAALFLVALNYLFLLKEELSFKNSILFAISIGLLIGTKTLAISYAGLLILPFLFLTLRKFEFKKSISLILSVAVFVIIFGSYSYIRNFIQTENPLYPLDVKLFGLNIFKGVEDKAAYLIHFKPSDYRLTKILFHEGAGGQVILFLFPAVFLALPIELIRKKKKIDLFTTYFLLLPLLLFLTWRYCIGLPNTRYLYPLLGVGFVSAFYLLDALRIPQKVIRFFVFICAVASIFELARHLELAMSMLASFVILFLWGFLGKYLKLKLRLKFAYLVVLSIISLFALTGLQNDYLKNEYDRYIKNSPYWKDTTLAWKWLNNNTQGDNIAYVGRPVPFPLYGTNFKNTVYYVSVNKIEPAKLHYFPNSKYIWGYDFESLHKNLEEPNNYRGNANYSDWLNNLKKRDTDYLFIYSLHQTKDIIFPIEDKWALENPHRFSQVFRNDTVRIYKFIKE